MNEKCHVCRHDNGDQILRLHLYNIDDESIAVAGPICTRCARYVAKKVFKLENKFVRWELHSIKVIQTGKFNGESS